MNYQRKYWQSISFASIKGVCGISRHFQQHFGGQFVAGGKPEYQVKNTDLSQVLLLRYYIYFV
jgi:hypothetical protein